MKVSEVIAGARRLVTDQGRPPYQRSSYADYVDFIEQALGHIATKRPDLFAARTEMDALSEIPMGDDRLRFQTDSNYHTGPKRSFRIIEVVRYYPLNVGKRERKGGNPNDEWFPVAEISYRPLADSPGVATLSRQEVRVTQNPLTRRGDRLYTTDRNPQWARHPQAPNNFFFFPKPEVDKVNLENRAKIEVEYARDPRPLDGVPAATEEMDDRVIPTAEFPLADAYYGALVACVAWLAESVNDESVVAGRAQMLTKAWQDALTEETQAREITDTASAAIRGVVVGRAGGAPGGQR